LVFRVIGLLENSSCKQNNTPNSLVLNRTKVQILQQNKSNKNSFVLVKLWKQTTTVPVFSWLNKKFRDEIFWEHMEAEST